MKKILGFQVLMYSQNLLPKNRNPWALLGHVFLLGGFTYCRLIILIQIFPPAIVLSPRVPLMICKFVSKFKPFPPYFLTHLMKHTESPMILPGLRRFTTLSQWQKKTNDKTQSRDD